MYPDFSRAWAQALDFAILDSARRLNGSLLSDSPSWSNSCYAESKVVVTFAFSARPSGEAHVLELLTVTARTLEGATGTAGERWL